ncbi:MAG TPA: cellulase-like family protein [Aquabacterium sp.]|uniref:cellulase-like family protein n=1 Tax=Aquabacterium sp. TaxID=1872578 RepID=UPI002E2F01FF|nr:cellulase-like family protein [Aquabacterium sp.]HEX5356224.1 cellulase-like family protein [Aquabacterium sp.]
MPMPHLCPSSNATPVSTPRRDALKHLASASLGTTMAWCAPGLSRAAQASPSVLTVRRPTLAVAMWDYSWLTRRAGTQAEYSDFDAVLDELVLRGYNCLRIDAFPHLIATDDMGRMQSEFNMRPQPSGFPWGNSASTTINPRRDLPIFLSKCATRGIRVGLSTWMTNDTSDRALRIQSPAQLARIWSETLDFIGHHGLLDMVEWVDLGNEFPSVGFMPAIVDFINRKLSNKIGQLHGYFLPYDQAQASAISAYIYMAINELKKRFPRLPLCVSLLGNGPTDSFKYHDLSPMDCIETHIWLNQNQAFALFSGLDVLLLESFGKRRPDACNFILERAVQAAYYRQKDSLLSWLAKAMDSWVALGNQLKVPVYTTEAWAATCFYELPALDPAGANWRWIRDIAQTATAMASARGWSGICTANYCQPHFPSFYKDPAWHRQITSRIKAP